VLVSPNALQIQTSQRLATAFRQPSQFTFVFRATTSGMRFTFMKVVLQSGWPLQRFVFFILFSNDSFSKVLECSCQVYFKHVPFHPCGKHLIRSMGIPTTALSCWIKWYWPFLFYWLLKPYLLCSLYRTSDGRSGLTAFDPIYLSSLSISTKTFWWN
jgi:hypothetical protein